MQILHRIRFLISSTCFWKVSTSGGALAATILRIAASDCWQGGDGRKGKAEAR